MAAFCFGCHTMRMIEVVGYNADEAVWHSTEAWNQHAKILVDEAAICVRKTPLMYHREQQDMKRQA